MDVTITANTAAALAIPLEFLFWGFVAVYVLHILEESLLGENFVDKLRRHFFPSYDWTKFFWFNTILLGLNVVAILIYDAAGGHWVIFPLALALERALNGVWHLVETIWTRRFSSGLLASSLTWLLTYFVVRYSLLKGEIAPADFALAALLGALITGLMLGSLLAVRAQTLRLLAPGRPR